IPAERPFATKPALARSMLAQAFQAGISARWVTGDSVYGDDRRLRLWLEGQERAYVLAVSGKGDGWVGWQAREGQKGLWGFASRRLDTTQRGRGGERSPVV